jgi:hypothetical protein
MKSCKYYKNVECFRETCTEIDPSTGLVSFCEWRRNFSGRFRRRISD